jgi:3-hydroxybutyrate dehydrogenase
VADRFLDGKVALVTGSAQGIGLAIAKSLAEAGACIVIHGLADDLSAQSAIAAVQAAGGGDTCFLGHNLRRADEVEALMDEAIRWRGRLDILVNNAGVQKTAALAELTPDVWDDIIAINLSAPFHAMRKALPRMAEQGSGRVINIASVHGLVASVDKGPYVASKFGLVGLSRVAALEYASVGSAAEGGITVNCICPGFIETSLIEPQIQARASELGRDRDAGVRSLIGEKQPSRRISQPQEIAALATWLCSPLAHNVTGTAIPIDGGWTAQ